MRPCMRLFHSRFTHATDGEACITSVARVVFPLPGIPISTMITEGADVAGGKVELEA